MIRLIACDIDGTLLQGEETAIRPAIFRRFAACGSGISCSVRPVAGSTVASAACSHRWPGSCPTCAKTELWSMDREIPALFWVKR